MIGTLKHLLNSTDILTVIICATFFLYLLALVLSYRLFKSNKKFIKVWRVMCFAPLVVAIIHFVVFTSGSAMLQVLPAYISVYIQGLLCALLPLLTKKYKIFKYVALAFIIICLVFSIFPLYAQKTANFTRQSMSEAYVSLCDYLEENYVLSEWKKVDYEKLKNDGLELIEEAEKTGDKDKYYTALFNLVNSFHDGHAGISFYNTENDYVIEKIKSFNDYGLSLMLLDDGSVIAVNVAENLETKNGDSIIKWDGIPVSEAIENVDLPIVEGTIENEKIQKTFYLAGVGDETVKVTYINSNGEENTEILKKIDSEYPTALKAFGTFTHSRNDEYMCKILEDDIGYLRVTEEEIDVFSDTFSYLTGDHTVAREKFRKDLRKLKNQGMTKLIIDIRNNAGGFDEVSMALTSLFTDEKMYAFSLGVKDGETLKSVDDRYVIADGEFKDLEILVLTSMSCGSAGDGLVLYLSRLENVTVAGITNPSGINQETGGSVYMPENVIVSFPVGLILDENGNPNIDLDETRQSRTPVDVKIPLDRESALKIFNGEDYELNWAVEYLNR